MTEPTDALLPCPFCGEAAKHSFNSLYGDMSMASCKSCGATAYAPKWNRRAVLAKWGSPVVAGEPVAVIEFTDGVKEPRIMSWNALPAGQHRVYTAPQPTQAQAGAAPLTPKQMESGREAIFSTGNPYCPCDSKTFRKVAEWVERHHGIKEGGQHGTE